LDLVTLLAGEAEDPTSLTSHLATLPEYPKRVGDPEAHVYDQDARDARCVSELRDKLKDLKIVSRAKVTQDRIYSAAYHPDVTKDLIFFGGT
jgi:WD repeat-containing protein 76